MNRQTGIGLMFRRDPGEAREEMVRVIRRLRGNLSAAAHDLGIHRRHMYKLIYREDLWNVVDEARVAVTEEPDLLRLAREAMKGRRHGVS